MTHKQSKIQSGSSGELKEMKLEAASEGAARQSFKLRRRGAGPQGRQRGGDVERPQFSIDATRPGPGLRGDAHVRLQGGRCNQRAKN